MQRSNAKRRVRMLMRFAFPVRMCCGVAVGMKVDVPFAVVFVFVRVD